MDCHSLRFFCLNLAGLKSSPAYGFRLAPSSSTQAEAVLRHCGVCSSHVLRGIHAPTATGLPSRRTILVRHALCSVHRNRDGFESRNTVCVPWRKAKPGSSELVCFTGMFDEAKDLRLAGESETGSLLCRKSPEKPEEIRENHCPGSEEGRYDPGFERALADWIIKHRSQWRRG